MILDKLDVRLSAMVAKEHDTIAGQHDALKAPAVGQRNATEIKEVGHEAPAPLLLEVAEAECVRAAGLLRGDAISNADVGAVERYVRVRQDGDPLRIRHLLHVRAGLYVEAEHFEAFERGAVRNDALERLARRVVTLEWRNILGARARQQRATARQGDKAKDGQKADQSLHETSVTDAHTRSLIQRKVPWLPGRRFGLQFTPL